MNVFMHTLMFVDRCTLQKMFCINDCVFVFFFVWFFFFVWYFLSFLLVDRPTFEYLSVFTAALGGRNSSLVVFGLAVHRVAGSILLWGNFPVEGIFPLELIWVQTPFPPKPRSSLCTHAFHRTDSKDPDVHVLDG